MGEEDEDEERFSSVVDTGKWRNIKVCNRLGKKKERDGEGEKRGEIDDKESNRGDGKRTVMKRKERKKLGVNWIVER